MFGQILLEMATRGEFSSFMTILHVYIIDSNNWRTGLNKDIAMTIPSVQDLMKREKVSN